METGAAPATYEACGRASSTPSEAPSRAVVFATAGTISFPPQPRPPRAPHTQACSSVPGPTPTSTSAAAPPSKPAFLAELAATSKPASKPAFLAELAATSKPTSKPAFLAELAVKGAKRASGGAAHPTSGPPTPFQAAPRGALGMDGVLAQLKRRQEMQ